MNNMLFFDHAGDRGHLYKECSTIGMAPLATSKDNEVSTELGSHSWQIAFLHIDDAPWNEICANLKNNQYAVRFSRETQNPFRYQTRDGLAFNCITKIDQLNEADLQAIAQVCRDDILSQRLRLGLVPLELQRLISMEEPLHLAGLGILFQAILAEIASDASQPDHKVAISELQLRSALPALGAMPMSCAQWQKDILSSPDFRKKVGHELGDSDLSKHTDLKQFLDAVDQASGDIRPDYAIGMKAAISLKPALL